MLCLVWCISTKKKKEVQNTKFKHNFTDNMSYSSHSPSLYTYIYIVFGSHKAVEVTWHEEEQYVLEWDGFQGQVVRWMAEIVKQLGLGWGMGMGNDGEWHGMTWNYGERQGMMGNDQFLSSDWDWDLGPGTWDLGIESRIENREWRIENRESRIKKRNYPQSQCWQ